MHTLGRTRVAGAAILLAAIATAVVIAISGGLPGAGAADHLDGPGLTPPGNDVRLDLTDVYAFRPRPGRTTLVMNVNGFTAAGTQARFATHVPSVASTKRVAYSFRVDNDGDAKPDVTLRVTFGIPNSSGVQTMRVERNGKLLVAGKTSPFGKVVVNHEEQVRVFAGMRDDPFFFDLQGFIDILSKDPGKSLLGCTSPRTDKFAKSNVSSIVVELRNSMLTSRGSSKIGVWATTNMGGTQVDRMGLPAIATVFIPNNPFEPKGSEPSLRDTYNHGRPSTDRAMFRSEITDTLTTLFSLNDAAGDDPADDAMKIDGLSDALLPDMLTLDTSSSKGFLNGRRLADDVIDAELGLVTEGAVTTDCVDANDKAFRSSFPYLAAPHA